MVQFSKNILYLFILWVILIQISFYFSNNPYWGNEVYEDKMQYLDSHQAAFNTAFIGSSRILSQINPLQFDSLTQNRKITSFNLGSPYMNVPESYYLYDYLLKQDDLKFDYVFLELTNLLSIEWSLVRVKRNYYWCNFESIKFAYKYLKAAPYSFKKKLGLFFFYLINYANKNLTLAHLNPHKELPTLDIPTKKGFGPMNAKFTSFSGLDMQKGLSEQYFSASNYSQYSNEFHLTYIKKLIKQSEEKGIHLIFLISPRMAFQYGEILAIKEQLPEKNIIEIGDVRKYPMLYLPELSSDDVHVNEAGAKIFTKLLAEQFEEQCFEN